MDCFSFPFNRKTARCSAMALQRIASGHFSVIENGHLPFMAAADCTNLTAEWESDELIAEDNLCLGWKALPNE